MFNKISNKKKQILTMKSTSSNEDIQPENIAEELNTENLELLQDHNMIGMDVLLSQVAAGLDTVFVVGEINLELATEISKHLMIIDQRNQITGNYDPISLIINSPGGDLHAAWMICDIMDSIETPIWSFGLGQVGSAGIIIFMNADFGHRYSSQNTQFMSHRFSMVLAGSHTDLISQKNEINRCHKRIVNHYKKCTGLSKNVIETELLAEHDIWLSSYECRKKFNIVDHILRLRKNHITQKDIRNGKKQSASRKKKRRTNKKSK